MNPTAWVYNPCFQPVNSAARYSLFSDTVSRALHCNQDLEARHEKICNMQDGVRTAPSAVYEPIGERQDGKRGEKEPAAGAAALKPS